MSTATLSTDELGFLNSIRDEPEDDTVRLVYADWLDEHDEPDRAELIRVQCELGKDRGRICPATIHYPSEYKEDRHRHVMIPPRIKPKEPCGTCPVCVRIARASAILAKHPDWLPPFPVESAVPVFRRGMIEMEVPTLGALFEQKTYAEICRNNPWRLTDYARQLRDGWPHVASVRVRDRVPYHNGGGYCWYDETRRNQTADARANVPLLLFKLLDGCDGKVSSPEGRFRAYKSSDAAQAAFGSAVARVLFSEEMK